MYAICNLTMIPLRKEDSDRSEMTSQILFGEMVEVIEQKKQNWWLVRQVFDDYTGWLDPKQIKVISDDDAEKIKSSPLTVTTDMIQIALAGGVFTSVVMGSTLPLYSGKKFRLGDTEYSYEGNVAEIKGKQPEKLLSLAHMYLNTPYLWGGRSPFGIDCSGFTQVVFKMAGYALRRDAEQQAEMGELVNLFQEALPGDLAFFDNAQGKIIHVGIVLPNNKIIHASGKVRIDTLDHQGIYNEDRKGYSHDLRMIRRAI